MVPSKNLLRNLLRILTPTEINELTTTYGGRKQIPLTEILNCEISGEDWKRKLSSDEDEMRESHGAKILPFNKVKEEASELDAQSSERRPLCCGEKVVTLLRSFYEDCIRMEKNLLGPKRPVRKNISGLKKEISTFIIEDTL